MAKKETKQAAEEPKEAKPYRATLSVGDKQLATITISATDDEDAKDQLSRSKPAYFDGVGDWILTKTETVAVE